MGLGERPDFPFLAIQQVHLDTCLSRTTVAPILSRAAKIRPWRWGSIGTRTVARVKEIKNREDMPSEHQAVLDEVLAAYNGNVVGHFWVLLHSPEVARRTSCTGDYVPYDLPLPADVRELVVIATARELDCLYDWNAHEGGARRAGVREEAIAAGRERVALEGLTDDESLVVTFVQELVSRHRVPEASF